jgi:type VI secretion system secreted protein VgrG
VNRGVRVKTLLGEDVLLFERMSGEEAIGRVFHYNLSMLSDSPTLDLSALLGKTITIEVDLPESGTRYFNGYVTSFSMSSTNTRHFRYQAVIRPWLWLLSLGSNSRIFQKMTVPDIVKQIFRERGFSDFREALFETNYRKWDYSVQYRETDLNYISRLLEQEGIYYFCEHVDGKHTVVLADSPSSHVATPGFEKVLYFPPGDTNGRDEDHLSDWSAGRQLRPGIYSSSDYDFTRPTASLTARLNRPMQQDHSDFEVYDYPGEYVKSAEGEKHVQVRLDQHQNDFEMVRTSGTVRGLSPGALFKLQNNRREDQNVEHLIVSASYEITTNDYETGGGATHDFEGSYTCVNSSRPYRAPAHTPKPKVDGPQTATVVGKKGEEIWTDEYGRVKVQFHWDREGERDENSSCWVRVSQVWAGTKWGSLHVPRIGQEVIVDFLEGDPDRPIVTGRVYNGDNMPPYLDPQAPTASATQSGIKSRSTPGGSPSNFNEIRFEDKKGKEELHVQAERDHSTLVKRNQSISVGADRSVSVGGNESISVTGTRTSTITKKETQTFKDDREMTVALTNTDEVTLLHTGKYHGGRTETVKKGDTLEVIGSNKVVTVHGEYNTVADSQFEVKQAGNQFLIKNEIILDNQKCKVDMKGGNTKITAADEIKLECGTASITLKKDGTIEISGSQKVKADGGGAGVELTAEGAKMSGAKASVSGTAMTEITGAMVKIN